MPPLISRDSCATLNYTHYVRQMKGVGLRPHTYWDWGFESHRGHGCLYLLSVVFCQVEVSASGWSVVQSSPTECGVSVCDRESSTVRTPWPTRDCQATMICVTLQSSSALVFFFFLSYDRPNKSVLCSAWGQTRQPQCGFFFNCTQPCSVLVSILNARKITRVYVAHKQPCF